jgi:hypothetical protein
VTIPYTHVLYPDLVHPLHYSPSYSIPLLKVTSTGFSALCSCLYKVTLLYPPHLISPSH